MSIAGIKQFSDNLDTLMESEAFKKADDTQRMVMGTRLLRSNYGVGSFLGKVCKLKKSRGDK
jgi:hypothetical protein